jgi:hypothetical protein
VTGLAPEHGALERTEDLLVTGLAPEHGAPPPGLERTEDLLVTLIEGPEDVRDLVRRSLWGQGPLGAEGAALAAVVRAGEVMAAAGGLASFLIALLLPSLVDSVLGLGRRSIWTSPEVPPAYDIDSTLVSKALKRFASHAAFVLRSEATRGVPPFERSLGTIRSRPIDLHTAIARTVLEEACWEGTGLGKDSGGVPGTLAACLGMPPRHDGEDVVAQRFWMVIAGFRSALASELARDDAWAPSCVVVAAAAAAAGDPSCVAHGRADGAWTPSSIPDVLVSRTSETLQQGLLDWAECTKGIGDAATDVGRWGWAGFRRTTQWRLNPANATVSESLRWLPIASQLLPCGSRVGMSLAALSHLIVGGNRSSHRHRTLGCTEAAVRVGSTAVRLAMARWGMVRAIARSMLGRLLASEQTIPSPHGERPTTGSGFTGLLRDELTPARRVLLQILGGGDPFDAEPDASGDEPEDEDIPRRTTTTEHTPYEQLQGKALQITGMAAGGSEAGSPGLPLQHTMDTLGELVGGGPLVLALLSRHDGPISDPLLRRLIRLATIRVRDGTIFLRSIILQTFWAAVTTTPATDTTIIPWRYGGTFWHDQRISKGIRCLRIVKYVEAIFPILIAQMIASNPGPDSIVHDSLCTLNASFTCLMPISILGGPNHLTRALVRIAQAADTLAATSFIDPTSWTTTKPTITIITRTLEPRPSTSTAQAIINANTRNAVIDTKQVVKGNHERAAIEAAIKAGEASKGGYGTAPTETETKAQVVDPQDWPGYFPLPERIQGGNEPTGICLGDTITQDDGTIGEAGKKTLRLFALQSEMVIDHYRANPRERSSLATSAGFPLEAWNKFHQELRKQIGQLLQLHHRDEDVQSD